jgi:hypothetical protein
MSALSPTSVTGPAEVRLFNSRSEQRQHALEVSKLRTTGKAIIGADDAVAHQSTMGNGSVTTLALTSRYRPTESI